jgi:hypothetical protein
LAATTRRQAGGNTDQPGVDSTIECDGGEIFGKPQERNSGVFDIGTPGPERVGKEARKVKRVDSIGRY